MFSFKLLRQIVYQYNGRDHLAVTQAVSVGVEYGRGDFTTIIVG